MPLFILINICLQIDQKVSDGISTQIHKLNN